MSAPIVPPDVAEPRRRAPTLRRLTVIHQPWWIFSFVLAGPATLGLVRGLLHGAPLLSSEALINAAFIAAGVALFWWRASRLRRAFVRGSEVLARVTDLKRYADDPAWVGTPARLPWDAIAVLIDRPTVLRPSTILCVVYPAEGGERAAQYLLDDEAVARLRPSVGSDITLIVDPGLREPLLRDAYLDP